MYGPIVATATIINRSERYILVMEKVTAKKAQIIQQITQYMIENGLSDVGLRKLAEVVGTSDRMLIYYFETKDELIGQVLQAIASNLAVQLDALLGEEKRSPDLLLRELYALSSTPQFDAIIRFWFEVIGLAAREQEPYAQYARVIAANWYQWIEGKLEASQTDRALPLFAELEGRFMLKMVGIESSAFPSIVLGKKVEGG